MIKPFRIILTLAGLILVNCNTHSTHEVESWGYAFFIDSTTIGAIKSTYSYDFPNGDYGAAEYYGGTVGIYTYDLNTKEVLLEKEISIDKLFSGCTGTANYPWLLFSVQNSMNQYLIYRYNFISKEIKRISIHQGLVTCINSTGEYGLSNSALINLNEDSIIRSDIQFPFFIDDSLTFVMSCDEDKFEYPGHIYKTEMETGQRDTISKIDSNFIARCKVLAKNKKALFFHASLLIDKCVEVDSLIYGKDYVKSVGSFPNEYIAFLHCDIEDIFDKKILYVGEKNVYLSDTSMMIGELDTLLYGYERVLN